MEALMYISSKFIRNVFISYVVFVVITFVSIFRNNVIAFNIDTNLSVIVSGERGSYFGYTVALLQSQDTPRFIVGAPKSDSIFYPKSSESGAVYMCTLDVKCEELKYGYNVQPKYELAGQLLGASLAVDEATNRIAVCGSRFGMVLNTPSRHLTPGSCHEYGFDSYGNQTFNHFYYPIQPPINKRGTLYRGRAQAGFSAHFLKKSHSLLLGAPGLSNWRGGYVLVDNATGGNMYTEYIMKGFQVSSLTGYSISSGTFSSDTAVYYVAGSPMAGKYGKVYIFSVDKKLIETLQGEQFMSRFGAAVCVGDLNRDSYDDLIVGAPMYSESREEGRAYVYESKGTGVRLTRKSILKGSKRVGGQFGTTISIIGDINNDGHIDFAIGAPFADEHRGAIYVYMGGPPGREYKLAQEIMGRHVSTQLMGFGQSISNPMDTDKNNMKDFAVGAFLSDKVVLLRARPVANVLATLTSSRELVKANEMNCFVNGRAETCITVYATFLYHGEHVPESIDIQYVLRADTESNESIESSRARFREGVEMVPEIRRNISLERGREYSGKFSHRAVILARKDIFTGIKFDLDFSLQTPCSTAKQCARTPVLSEDTGSKKELNIQFQKNCKKSRCESNLALTALAIYSNKYNSKALILTPHSTVTLMITLINRKEPAYFATVSIAHHRSFTVSHIERVEGNVQCHVLGTDQLGNDNPYETANLECLIGNPLVEAQPSTFHLILNAGKFIAYSNTTNITVRAKTLSYERNEALDDNYINIVVILKRHILLSLTSFSSPEQIGYGGHEMHLKANNSKPSLNYLHIPLTQRVSMRNTGQSSMGGCDVILTIPAVTMEDTVFFSSTVEVQSNDIDVTSSCVYTDANKYEPCKSSQWRCSKVKCVVEAIRPGVEVQFIIRGRVYEEALALIQSKSLKLDTFVSVTLRDDPLLTIDSHRHASTVISTALYRKLPQHKSIAIWMYVISALSGVLVLCVIMAVMWKRGFFKRRMRSELQKLVERQTEAVRPLHSPTDDLETEDNDMLTDQSEPPTTPCHLEDVDENTLTRSTTRDRSFVFTKPDERAYGNTTYFVAGESGTRV